MSERYAARTQSPPSSISHPAEQPHSSYYRPSEGESSGRLSPPPTWQTRSGGSRADSNRHRQTDVYSYRPTHTLPNLSLVAGPSLADAPNHLSFRSEEAESERTSTRIDSRRLREQQDMIDDLQIHLEFAIRRKAAAEEHAKAMYDLGFKHGMQIIEAQTLARASALPHGLLPYPIPPPMQPSPVPFQGPKAGYGHIKSQMPSTSRSMPRSPRDAPEASKQRPPVPTSSHSMSPLAPPQYGSPAMLPSSTEHPQPESSNGDEVTQCSSAGKTRWEE